MKWLLSFIIVVVLIRQGLAADLVAEPKKKSIWEIEVESVETGKFSVKGSVFGIGDPVHETLTIKALIDSGLAKNGVTNEDPDVVQFVRGVFWNDDPCAQLFAENEFQPLKPSYGVSWYSDFLYASKYKDHSFDFKSLSCELLGRSHFGDLQFLHGMADKDGVKPADTAAKMIVWANVMYRVAIGQIDANESLDADKTAKHLINQLSAKITPMELFRAKTKPEAKARALGSLLHMIQDSYSYGHVKREKSEPNDEGAILQFLSYINQNAKKHAHDDKWSAGSTDLEKTLSVPGARRALIASTEICKLYKSKIPWEKVEQYLINGPLVVSKNAVASGPGDYK